MSEYNKYLESVYSEELHQVSEAEHDEVMGLMAEDFDGYGDWSAEVEQAAWSGSQEFNGVLIKKSCEHSTCGHFRCEREIRLGGIAI